MKLQRHRHQHTHIQAHRNGPVCGLNSLWCSGCSPLLAILLCTHQTGCSGKKKGHDDKTVAHYSAHPDTGLFIQIKICSSTPPRLPPLSLSLSRFCCSSATISLFCAFPWQYQTFPLPPPPSSCLFSHVTLASVLLTLPCKKSLPIFLQIFLSVLCPCLSFSRFYFSCKLTSPAILLSSHLKPVAACHPITADHPDDVSVSHSSQMTMTQPGYSVTRDTLGSSNLRSHLFVPMHV